MWCRFLFLCFLICSTDCSAIRKRQATTRESENGGGGSKIKSAWQSIQSLPAKIIQTISRQQPSDDRDSEYYNRHNNNYRNEQSRSYGDDQQIIYEQNQKPYTNSEDNNRELNRDALERQRQFSYTHASSQFVSSNIAINYNSPPIQQPFNNNPNIQSFYSNNSPQNDPVVYENNQNLNPLETSNHKTNRNDFVSSENNSFRETLNDNRGALNNNRDTSNNNKYPLVDENIDRKTSTYFENKRTERPNFNLGYVPDKISNVDDRRDIAMKHVPDNNPILAPNDTGKVEIEFPPTLSYDENLPTTTRASFLDFIKNSRTTQS